MRRTFLLVPMLAVVAMCQSPAPSAQDPKPAADPKPQDAQAVIAEVQRQFAAEKIVVDSKAETVTIPAVVNHTQDPFEYLLIHRKGKRHEAMFWTPTKPSVLNAALLMLGLTPGQNATYVEKQPPPTQEEIEKGADPLVVTPPKGAPFWMTVKWKDEAGKDQEACVEDLILDLSTQQPLVDASWVYLGGRMARLYRNEPEVYIADFEGNLISICYLSPDNHLGTMVHTNARDDQNWWMTDRLPKVDTEVQFVFHKNEPALHKERQSRLQREKKAAETSPPAKGGDGKK